MGDDSHPDFNIRQFTVEDQNECHELILSGLGEHFDLIKPEMNPDLDDIAASYLASGGHFLVAEMGGKIIGTGGLVSDGESEGQIVRMSVRRDLRGRGVGRQLVRHLLEMARERSLGQVNVETNHDWFPAINLYKRCGFRESYRDAESVHMVIEL